MGDKVTKLYNAFVSGGYAMEPEAEFRKNLNDPKKRRSAYDALVKDGYKMEPFEEFERNIGYGGKGQPAAQATRDQSQGAGKGASVDKPLRPTTQEKIGMAMRMNQQVGAFSDMMNGKVEQTRRMTERRTERGRNMKKAAAMQARAQGLQAEPEGLLRVPVAQLDLSDEDGSAKGEGSTRVQDMTGPTPYAVVEVDGEKRVQYMLPDGSLTTDWATVNNSAIGAREARLQHEFENRMKGAGLDVANQKDVELQKKLDSWNEEQRHDAYVYQQAQEKRQELADRLEDAEKRLKDLYRQREDLYGEREAARAYVFVRGYCPWNVVAWTFCVDSRRGAYAVG